MKSYAPCLLVCLFGLLLVGWSAFGLAVSSPTRAAAAKTRKAPPTPDRRTAGLRVRFDNTPPGKTVWARLP